ncbi:questin oxidase family protein [Streptomyces litchfieldiae]|uniref:Questin oxidase family protein n=1 Tax=Streptomyces litchfieldiae TaxID=3075543 RepID=A0ABU2N0C7_9ACTN|nr:questin oxidase family protein [Streptomyces sp. DSM 44938]MDT0347351.1 questin oxidase family protein [Streptomyces sp. DSM 44938]
MDTDATGTLDEALVRLHDTGPEIRGWLTNHAPMTVEALARHGHGARVHRWLDSYRARLEEPPASYGRITAENWRAALGDARHLADWITFFGERLAEAPWRAVLAEWWPRLLPGIVAGATHPVIRVGHAVRLLLTDGETGPRLAELAHGLGYWAARHQQLPSGIEALAAPEAAGAALRAVPPVPDRSGGIRHRLPQITALPAWAASPPADPDAARERLRELVRAAVGHYATHAHGQPVMLVHAATAPNAVLRTLPALPRELWPASLGAAWTAAAGVVASYAPDGGPRPAPAAGGLTAEEVFERAAAHGDEHVIKLTDTVLDVTAAHPGDEPAWGAALRSIELIDPED